jgi:hypothetical protein
VKTAEKESFVEAPPKRVVDLTGEEEIEGERLVEHVLVWSS